MEQENENDNQNQCEIAIDNEHIIIDSEGNEKEYLSEFIDDDFSIENENNTAYLKLKSYIEEKIIANNNIYMEPDWKLLIYNWMTPKIKGYFFKEKMFKKILNDANIIFLEGILFEYGEEGYEQSYEKAFEKYNEGLKQNNQYCLFRMYFILINENLCKQFKLRKSFELAFIFLIKSCAYNECYLEMSKIEPAHKLSSILQSIFRKTDFLHKCINLHEKKYFYYKDNKNDPNIIINLIINNLEAKYLKNFLLLSFPNYIFNLNEGISKLENIAMEHEEACFKLACIYYNPPYKEHIKRDVQKSIKYFEILYNKKYLRSLCSYMKVCEEQKIDRLDELYRVAKKMRGYACHFYANYLCRDKDNLEINKNKILKYFFKSLLFGNLISISIIFEIFTKLYLSKFKSCQKLKKPIDLKIDFGKDFIVKEKENKNKNNIYSTMNNNANNNKNDMDLISIEIKNPNDIDNNTNNNYMNNFSNNDNDNDNEYDINDYIDNKFTNIGISISLREFLELIFEFVDKQRTDEHINKILDYDILVLFYQIYAYFFYKGYLVEKNIQTAVNILEETLKKEKSYKCYRKVFYYLGKSYKKLGNIKKYEFFSKKSFDIYLLLSEFPYHHLVAAKIFLKGIKGVPRNLDNAIFYLKKGANYSENFFLINVMYSKKCEKYLRENSEIKLFVESNTLKTSKIIVENYIDSEKICIICYENFTQVRHINCKHMLICLICYEKMSNKSQCPFCKQVSEIKNEFFLNTDE
jgi:hypothetical protein